MTYRLVQNVELVERDREFFLMAKTPLRALRINSSLAELLQRGKCGVVNAATSAEETILEQLAAKGFVERFRGPDHQPAGFPTVSVVIPVKDRAAELQRCLMSVSQVRFPREKLQVIVVDDGSTDASSKVASEYGALVVPSGGTGLGPAAARNAGAAAAQGEILAFIDSDCTASENWLADLLPSFRQHDIAAVGGFVDGLRSTFAIDRYEAVMSSLSLGSRERVGKEGDDTFYLPSCNLLVRRIAFQAAGGFNHSMNVGEDVDLTWRLRDEGWSIKYLPSGRVCHEHRSTPRSFMSRRFDYGTSEGILQILHPHRRKRMVIPPLLALILFLCCAAPAAGWGTLSAALGVFAADVAVCRTRLARRRIPVGVMAVVAGRVRALGSLVYYLCYHLIRYYASFLIAISIFFPLFLLVFISILGCAARVDYAVKKPEMPFMQFTAVYLLEQISYGAGVFWGCFRSKSFATYRVALLRHAEASS